MAVNKGKEIGVQTYAAWAMISRPTQTGMDIRFHDVPEMPTITTITARPWVSNNKNEGKYRRGTATQAKARRVKAATQTPKGGPGAARRRPGTMEKSEVTSRPDEKGATGMDQSWDVIPEDELWPRKSSSQAQDKAESELSWCEADLLDDPILDVPRLNPNDPLGLMQTEAMIDRLLASPLWEK